MIYILNILIVFLLTVINVSFLHQVEIFGVTPILPLFLVVALTYFRKGFEPLMLAAFAGFLFDLFSANPFGFYIILFLSVSALIRFLYQEGMKEMTFAGFWIFSLIGITTYYVAQILIIYLNDGYLDIGSIFFRFITVLLVNAAWGLVLYFLSNWYFDKVKQIENRLKIR
ncbi:MAG: rod shape-determining protein MreD [Patescibacteria group bacterium]|nr:rod shape-determining protein MreD [Patescibacteria group bacterium]